eukprot:m.134528 g.134528  ORF g.134528 m.134528 type:complete len:272 (+) comp29744_c1_seq1:99-914(+)
MTDSYDLVLVRHGESVNNILGKELASKISFHSEQFEREWMNKRLEDPPLSDEGHREADMLGKAMQQERVVPRLQTLAAQNNVAVYTSPMLRTLQTTAPLAKHLSVPVHVHPLLYEVGGVYTGNPQPPHNRVGGETGLTASEINSQFPSYNTAALKPCGPWYTGAWETDAAGRQRLSAVRDWLCSASFMNEHKNKVVIIVAHSHMISVLLQSLLGISQAVDASRDLTDRNNYQGMQTSMFFRNTSTCRLKIVSNGNVAVHWLGSTSHLDSRL